MCYRGKMMTPMSELMIGLNIPEREELEERAAILEFDAGLPRDEAERQAREMVLARRKYKWPTPQ
jgi:hypothetical protein